MSRSTSRIGVLGAAIVAGAAWSLTASAGPPQFEAIPVTGPSPYIYTWIMDLSDEGHAVGYASAAAPALDPARAFLWDEADAPAPAIDLGSFSPSLPYSTAEAVNDHGVVVGWAQVGPGAYRGFIWTAPGPMVQLTQFSRAIDIDNDGRVLGLTASGGAIWHNGVYTNFPPLPGGNAFVPAAMNDHGQVVGRGFSVAGGKVHAFLYDNGTYIDLGMARGDDFDSEARAINNHGVVAGMSRSIGAAAITSRMVIWEPDGAGGMQIAHVVDPLPGDYVFEVMDINDAGDVVGMSGWPQTPVLWTGGELHNINSLLAPDQSAVFFIGTAINNHGWIAVDGMFGCCAYVLKPIPADPEECPADLTGDGVVDIFDLLAVLAAWGPCDGPRKCEEDLTGDGVVDIFDLLQVLASWGPCS